VRYVIDAPGGCHRRAGRVSSGPAMAGAGRALNRAWHVVCAAQAIARADHRQQCRVRRRQRRRRIRCAPRPADCWHRRFLPQASRTHRGCSLSPANAHAGSDSDPPGGSNNRAASQASPGLPAQHDRPAAIRAVLPLTPTPLSGRPVSAATSLPCCRRYGAGDSRRSLALPGRPGKFLARMDQYQREGPRSPGVWMSRREIRAQHGV
jgi:hypothetical protein